MIDTAIDAAHFIDSLEGIAAKVNGAYPKLVDHVLAVARTSLPNASAFAHELSTAYTGMTESEAHKIAKVQEEEHTAERFRRAIQGILEGRKYGYVTPASKQSGYHRDRSNHCRIIRKHTEE